MEIKMPRREIVKILRKNTGKFFSVVYKKKGGAKNTINGYQNNTHFITDMGELVIKDEDNTFKYINPRKIVQVNMGGHAYVARW